MKYYIAYGSNLNMEQMQRRCPDARYIGGTILEGWELLFKGSKTGAYLTIEKNDNDRVPVGIWLISKADEMALDIYEGYPRFYYKKNIEIEGKQMMAYVMHEDRRLGVPSERYVETCLQGYFECGFDEEYIFRAIEKSGGYIV